MKWKCNTSSQKQWESLWVPEIHNIKEYFVCVNLIHNIVSIFTNHNLEADVEVAAANVLDLFAMIDPSKMTLKLKLHLLAQLWADILHFGPLVSVATETFECFNAIFRFCSIFSNHLAPSQDIAFQLASQEVLKHWLTSGWWPTEDGKWERPGPSVCNFIHTHPILQALMGWTNTNPLINGRFYLLHLSVTYDVLRFI